MTVSEGALFEPAGDRFVATGLSRGPWDPGACHGGPVSALLTRAVERLELDGDAWQLARLTVELTRPVPVGKPLTLTTAVERPGRKVSLVAAALADGDTEVARVRALRIRRAELQLPVDSDLAVDVTMPPWDGIEPEVPTWAIGDDLAFHSNANEHRFVESRWDVPGPVAVWIRLNVPLIAGEEPSGVQRAMAAADFGNGISGSLAHEDWVFINPDLTVHLVRPPEGEWIGMRTASRYSPTGAGLAESELFDVAGRLGRSCQSLFVDRR
ncbi:MAG: thioesterase family protein [Ilumatobacteraceae bacterium]